MSTLNKNKLILFDIIRDNQIVAHGVEFPNHKCVVNWIGLHQSIVVWDSFGELQAVNGHSNTTFSVQNFLTVTEAKVRAQEITDAMKINNII